MHLYKKCRANRKNNKLFYLLERFLKVALKNNFNKNNIKIFI